MYLVGIKKLGKPMLYFVQQSSVGDRGLSYDKTIAWRFNTFEGAFRIAKGYENSCVLSDNW